LAQKRVAALSNKVELDLDLELEPEGVEMGLVLGKVVEL
jgi:hypothetical protein